MSPEKAKILLVDSDRYYLDVVKTILESAGHTVISADSLTTALQKIANLHDDAVDVALIDDDLSASSRGGQDGQRLAQIIRSKFPGVPVYANALDPLPWSNDPTSSKLDSEKIILDRIKKS